MSVDNSLRTRSVPYQRKPAAAKPFLLMKTALVANAIFLCYALYHLYHGNYGYSILFLGLAELSGEAAVTARNYLNNPGISVEEAAKSTFVLLRAHKITEKIGSLFASQYNII